MKRPSEPNKNRVTIARQVSELSPEVLAVYRSSSELKVQIDKHFTSGGTISITNQPFTPKEVLKSIEQISTLSQHNFTVTWLPLYVRTGQEPHISIRDKEQAQSQGVSLEAALAEIRKQRLLYKQYAAFTRTGKSATILTSRLNKALEPSRLEYAARKMVFDSADKRTEIAQTIIKALLVIGPIAHFLEHIARGWGKVFAASVDDLLTEAAEFFALRGAGFPWSALVKRVVVLAAVFVAATVTVLHIEDLLIRNDFFAAGLLFGLCAVALSLTTAVQSIFMFRSRAAILHDEGKLPAKMSVWWAAAVQDFTNPARQGLFLGALLSPLLAAVVFSSAHSLAHNGWALAFLGSTETIVAGITVLYAEKILEFRFNRRSSKLNN